MKEQKRILGKKLLGNDIIVKTTLLKMKNLCRSISQFVQLKRAKHSFGNSQIIDYEDNFKYMSDVLFSIYFDFETTTGHALFCDSKTYVMSYCLIFTFNKGLDMDKIVIYRGFQQTSQQLYDLSHFRQEQVSFFDRITLKYLKDAASAVVSREKCTSLAELFSTELKFTIDTLKSWHTRIMKPKCFELDSYDKKEWIKNNPLTRDAVCTICDFPMDPESESGWFDHAAKTEHLILRNIYSTEEMEKMEISNIDDCKGILFCLLNIHHHFQVALQDGTYNDEIKHLMVENLNGMYDNFSDYIRKYRRNYANLAITRFPTRLTFYAEISLIISSQ